MSTAEHIDDVVADLLRTYHAKNSDYGNSVDITYQLFGNASQLSRLWDKLLRCTQLSLTPGINPNVDEKYLDTLKDLAVYAIIAYTQLLTDSNNKNASTEFSEFLNLIDEKMKGVKVI